MDNRFERQLDFICQLDKLKNVQRQTWLMDTSRKENSAEHSWHIAVMAMVLGEYAPDGEVDVSRVIQMLLVHDIVEIDAGDTFCYDGAAVSGQHDREQAAARRLFGILPEDIGRRFHALWDEFEARETPESRLANALDRLQPILNNYHTSGKSWQENGISRDQVLARNRELAQGAPALWTHVQELLARAVEMGILPRSAP
ncbi:MAG: HD domain-containing protein [Desulfobacterales bacterium]|nr:HD domain-containing protein [Desulfobacterales bacterium]